MSESSSNAPVPESFCESSWTRRAPFLLPLLLVAFSYAESPLGEFVWDDHQLISEQASVRELAPLGEYFQRMFWSDPLRVSRGFYRPLVTLSYAIEYQLWDGGAWGFHLTNVVLHMLVTVLVYWLCRRTGASPWAASLASAVFALFPRLSESVAWISGRTDLLAASCVLVAMLAWSAGADRPRNRWLAALAILLGLLCKEVAAAAIVGIVAFEGVLVRRGGRAMRDTFRRLWVLALPVIVYGAMRYAAGRVDVRAMQERAQIGVSGAQRWEAFLASVARYAGMVLDPWHPQTQIGRLGEHPAELVVVGGLVILVWWIVAAWLWRSARPLPFAAFMAGSFALVMVLHLVPLALNVLAADRFLYLPIALGCVGLAGFFEGTLKRRRVGQWATVGVGILLLSFAMATRQRVRVWNDEYLLWSDAAHQARPGEFYAHHQLATLLMDAKLWSAALEQLHRAEAEMSDAGALSIWNNIALCLDRLGRREEAVRLFEQMAAQREQDQRIRFNLVMVYLRAGRFDDARRELSRLDQRLPGNRTVSNLLSLVEESQRTWQRLPLFSPDESVELTAERARYSQSIGNSFDAGRGWVRVVDDPRTSLALRREAVTNLVFESDLDTAASAISRLRRDGGGVEELDSLEDELKRRSRLLR